MRMRQDGVANVSQSKREIFTGVLHRIYILYTFAEAFLKKWFVMR